MNKFITLLTFVLVVHHSLFAEESMTIKDNYTINVTLLDSDRESISIGMNEAFKLLLV